ncbi:biliverdin-producing heme oxygenase [Thalassococcus sp. BH17M4-6]|uniref:biliverdin-producing heme oxygenase n=1 Tax=Thalassococcus sp. BH17M4-6 TaxID=3413148 RepID=UPI003BBBE9CB
MTETPHRSLRLRLQTETRASHQDLDQSVSQFDLRKRDGFELFLRMQSVALRAISPHAAPLPITECINDLLARAEADLREIGTWEHCDAMEIGSLHPLAINYVIAGSRLGTKVLRTRWLSADDPVVRGANSYFSAPSYIELWKSFCETSNGMPAAGDVADQIVCDADKIFKLYRTCAPAPQITNGVVHA